MIQSDFAASGLSMPKISSEQIEALTEGTLND